MKEPKNVINSELEPSGGGHSWARDKSRGQEVKLFKSRNILCH